ncbi:MAG: DinB family protein [Acidithiobacillales bacterium]
MPEPASWIRLLLVRELEAFARELSLFPNDEMVWATLPGISNSAGTLALHVCGNLEHFVGGILGASGYLRDRDAEFSRRGVSRDELAREIRQTIRVIDNVLPGLSSDDLALEYPEAVGGLRFPTGLFLLHLCAHAAHHLGQAGYLRRALTGESRHSEAISVKALGREAGS